MLDPSDKSKLLIFLAHDIFNMLTPEQIFSQCYTKILKRTNLFKWTRVYTDHRASA